jgi:aminoglycoside phosphotransferase (APT) family kinase protein
LRERGSTLRPLAETLVHGDFIAKNLLLQDGRLVVCDFDDCVLGDPVQDVARFLVDLRFLEDRDSHVVNLRPCDPARVESMAAVFTQAYRARARWPVSDEHLAWHRQVQLIAKIHYYYKRQQFRPGFERDLDDMLALLSGPA